MNSSNWQIQDKLYLEDSIVLDEWHCYTIVFKNTYDNNNAIDAAYVYIYVDGEIAGRMELSLAAGLSYTLGSYDDGSYGDPNGGFNVGGYYENETVKRGCVGILDNLMIFDGALSADEVKTLCYTVAVNNSTDTDGEPSSPTDPIDTTETDNGGLGTGAIVGIVCGCVAAVAVVAVVAVVIVKKRKS